MKKSLACLTLSLAALSVSACTMTRSATDLPPGRYESSTKSVDNSGTATKKEATTNVYYDADGNKKATVDTKTTKDPKGLFNKSTSESHESIQ